jgi:hypothetical protein
MLAIAGGILLAWVAIMVFAAIIESMDRGI